MIVGAEPPGPPWLRKWLGDDFFADATHVSFYDWGATDDGLKCLEGLLHLRMLDLNRTEVSDAGLAHIRGLTRLRRLDLGGTNVGDAGLQHLEGLSQLEELNLGAGIGQCLGGSNFDLWSPPLTVDELSAAGSGGSAIDGRSPPLAAVAVGAPAAASRHLTARIRPAIPGSLMRGCNTSND